MDVSPVARTLVALKKSSGMAGSESVRYIALGDSVTTGWLEHGVLDTEAAYPALFTRRLSFLFPHAIINRINSGLGGDNAAGIEARLQRDCLRHAPHLITLCVGLNDMRGGKEGVGAFTETLTRIIQSVQESEIDLILLTPNVRGDALQEDGTAVEYIRAIRAVARAHGVPLADVYAVYQGAVRMGASPADLLSNRVSHPTREGHQIFANALMPFFQP